jgi:hypothetical protein
MDWIHSNLRVEVNPSLPSNDRIVNKDANNSQLVSLVVIKHLPKIGKLQSKQTLGKYELSPYR